MRPEVPTGWKVEPQSAASRIQQDAANMPPNSRCCPTARRRRAIACARCLHADGRDYSEGYSLVTRPDIGGFFYYQPAVQRASDRRSEGPARI